MFPYKETARIKITITRQEIRNLAGWIIRREEQPNIPFTRYIKLSEAGGNST